MSEERGRDIGSGIWTYAPHSTGLESSNRLLPTTTIPRFSGIENNVVFILAQVGYLWRLFHFVRSWIPPWKLRRELEWEESVVWSCHCFSWLFAFVDLFHRNDSKSLVTYGNITTILRIITVKGFWGARPTPLNSNNFFSEDRIRHVAQNKGGCFST